MAGELKDITTGPVQTAGFGNLDAYFKKVGDGVESWTSTSALIGYRKGGAHGRILEKGFHPRGSRTKVPGIFTLRNAKSATEREVKPAVLRSIEKGGPAAAAELKKVAEMAMTRIIATSPRRSGNLAGSTGIRFVRAGRGRR